MTDGKLATAITETAVTEGGSTATSGPSSPCSPSSPSEQWDVAEVGESERSAAQPAAQPGGATPTAGQAPVLQGTASSPKGLPSSPPEVGGSTPPMTSGLRGAAGSVLASSGGPSLDLRELTALCREHQRHSKSCHGRDIVLVIGDTGAGKSTTIGWALGHQVQVSLVRRKMEDGTESRKTYSQLDLKDAPEGLRVGHESFNRETAHLRSFQDPKEEHLFWVDSPGALDTEGITVAIANAIAIAHIASSCNKVRVVLLVPFANLKKGSARGEQFRKTVDRMCQFFPSGLDRELLSVAVFFTHPEPHTDPDEVYDALVEFKGKGAGPGKSHPADVDAFLKHMLQLLNDGGKDLVLRPADSSSDSFRRRVLAVPPIESPHLVFGCPLEAGEAELLRAECDACAQRVRNNLWSCDLEAVRHDLDVLQVVAQTARLPMLLHAYERAASFVVEDFHAKLHGARRCLDNNDFAEVRNFLGHLREDLITGHTELMEAADKESGKPSVKDRRDDLIFAINDKAKAFHAEATKLVSGTVDIEAVGRAGMALTSVQRLVDGLSPQLFRENAGLYGDACSNIEALVASWDEQAQHWIATDRLRSPAAAGIALGLADSVPPLAQSAAPLATAPLSAQGLAGLLGLLRAASHALPQHLPDALQVAYNTRRHQLDERLRLHRDTLREGLGALCANNDWDVAGCVAVRLDQLQSPAALLQAAHADLSEHLNESAEFFQEHQQHVEEITQGLKDRLEQLLAVTSGCNFEAANGMLCQLEVLAGLSDSSLVQERFHDQRARVALEVEKLLDRALRQTPRAEDCGTCGAFRDVALALDDVRRACAALPRHLELGRRCQEPPRPEAGCSESSQADLHTLYSVHVAELGQRLEAWLDAALLAVWGGECANSKGQRTGGSAGAIVQLDSGMLDLDRLHTAVCRLGPMRPLSQLFPALEPSWRRVAEGLAEQVRMACHRATMAAGSGLNPAEVEPALWELDHLAKKLGDVEKSPWEVITSATGDVTCVKLHSELKAAGEESKRLLSCGLDAAVAAAKRALEQVKFAEAAEQLLLVQASAERLQPWLDRRPAEAQKELVAQASQVFADCEQRLRRALADGDLSEGQRVLREHVGPAQKLRAFLPQVEGAEKALTTLLNGHRDEFTRKVDQLLRTRQFAELAIVMHGAADDLQKGAPEHSKRWRDAVLTVLSDFEKQVEEATAAVRAARMSQPLRLDAGRFTCVASAVRTLQKTQELDADGRCLAGVDQLGPPLREWLDSLLGSSDAMLLAIKEAGARSLQRWQFREAPFVVQNFQVLANVPSMGEKCEEELNHFRLAVLEKVKDLEADLAKLVCVNVSHNGATPIHSTSSDTGHGDSCGDVEVTFETNTRQLDKFFDELYQGGDAVDELELEYERLLRRLEERVGSFYAIARQYLREGQTEVAEKLKTAARRLQLSEVVRTKTQFTPDLHRRLLDELDRRQADFLSRRVALRDPEAFNRQLQELKNSDHATYESLFLPFKNKLVEEAGKLRPLVLGIADVDLAAPGKQSQLRTYLQALHETERLSRAIADHGDDELHVAQMLEGLQQGLLCIQKRGEEARDFGNHGELELCQDYLKTAAEQLRNLAKLHPLQPPFEELLSLVEPYCTEMRAHLDEHVDEMCKGWRSVCSFDVFGSGTVGAVVRFVRDLRSSAGYLRGKARGTLPPKFSAEMVEEKLKQKLAEVEGVKADTIHSDSARLANAEANLRELAAGLPEVGADQVRQHLVDKLRLEAERLRRETLAKFEQAQASAAQGGDADKDMKQVNRQLEQASQLYRAFEACPGVFPTNILDPVVSAMKESAQRKHDAFLSRDVTDSEEVAKHVHGLFWMSALVSDAGIKECIRVLVSQLLAHLESNKGVDFGDLGCAFGQAQFSLGAQILDEFEQFKEHKHRRINEKTAWMDFEHALRKLKEMNPHIQQAQLDALNENWGRYDSQYKRLLAQYYYAPREVTNWVKREMRKFRERAGGAVALVEIVAGICAAISLELSERPRRPGAPQVMQGSAPAGPPAAPCGTPGAAAPSAAPAATPGAAAPSAPSVPSVPPRPAAAAAQDPNSSERRRGQLHPHPVQVLAIFRLLRVDAGPSSWLQRGWEAIRHAFGTQTAPAATENHLVEISTGEGKSIVMAATAIFLALYGFEVDCACYSSYLSDRDKATFARLFSNFDVCSRIHYGTFTELARNHVNQGGDVREGTRAFMEGRLSHGVVPARQAMPKILLLDEVDVFFSPDFYGKSYRPSVLIQSPEITELVQAIWDCRKSSPKVEDVMGMDAYVAVRRRFPQLQDILDAHVRALVAALSTYDGEAHKSKYEVLDDRIQYKDHGGTLNDRFAHGYDSTFAYLKWHGLNKISQQSLDRNIGLHVTCGSFSYAEIPSVYQYILGVTGTLRSLTDFEKSTIKKYNIAEQTFMPSMYNQRSNDSDLGLEVGEGLEDYHHKIHKEIIQAHQNDRSVLVFFEDEDRLKAFCNSSYGSRLKDNYSAVTSGNLDRINHYVKQSTRRREITLFVRAFCRGLDFVCYDKQVNASGGVLVLSTFFSELESEEIQMMGRTNRQGESGNFKRILLQEDLLKWRQEKLNQQAAERGGGAVPAAGLAGLAPGIVTTEEIRGKTAADLLELLRARRKEWLAREAGRRAKAVDQAYAQHLVSLEFQKLLCEASPQAQAKLAAHLASMSRSRPSSFNIAFCLDESGSMRGPKWDQLAKAFQKFCERCIEQGGGQDLLSVIQFGEVARLTISSKTVATAARQGLQMKAGGDTLFRPALSAAGDALKKMEAEGPGATPLLIFMSDGANTDGDVREPMRQLLQQVPGLQCHTVFFGKDGKEGMTQLEVLARAVPGGQSHRAAVDGISLLRAFEGIAAELTAM